MLNTKTKQLLYTYFTLRHGYFSYRRGWLKGDCLQPECGKHNKAGINLTLNKSNCFVCGAKVKPFKLLMDVEGFTTKEQAMGYLRNLTEDNPKIAYYEPQVEKLTPTKVLLPESFKLLNQGDSMFARNARNYMVNRRGFELEDLISKGVGYCTSGKYQGYIILPYFNENRELIYFTTRRYMGSGPKFNNPLSEDFGISKSRLIYNMVALQLYSKVRVAESWMNANTLGEDTIALGGKAISPWQKSHIINSPVERLDILLDPDALKEAYELALELVDYKKVRVIKLPGDEDVNSYGKKLTKRLIHKTPYQSYQELYQLYKKL